MMPATDIREFCHQVREAARDAEHSESSAVGAMASRGVLCQCSVTAALRRYALEQAPLQARLWHEDASARQEISPRQAADLQNFHAAMFWAIWIDYEVADAISACGPAEQVAARLDHFYGRLPLPILRHHLTGGRGCPSLMLRPGIRCFIPPTVSCDAGNGSSSPRCWAGCTSSSVGRSVSARGMAFSRGTDRYSGIVSPCGGDRDALNRPADCNGNRKLYLSGLSQVRSQRSSATVSAGRIGAILL